MNRSRLSASSIVFVCVIFLLLFGASRLVKINKIEEKNSINDFVLVEHTLSEEEKILHEESKEKVDKFLLEYLIKEIEKQYGTHSSVETSDEILTITEEELKILWNKFQSEYDSNK